MILARQGICAFIPILVGVDTALAVTLMDNDFFHKLIDRSCPDKEYIVWAVPVWQELKKAWVAASQIIKSCKEDLKGLNLHKNTRVMPSKTGDDLFKMPKVVDNAQKM